MPKINAYSRDNYNNTLSFLDLHISWLNQPVLTTSDPTFNSVTTTEDVIVGRDLYVEGNAVINGNTTIISTDIVEIKDNIVLINSEETGAGVTLNLAGVEVERGTLPNFQTVFQESTDLYKIGEVGNLQAVATREDLPLDKGIMVYNDLLNRIDSTTTIELPITFSAGVNSTSSSTGTVILSGGGGLGVTGDIYTDNRLYIKGTTYSSYLDSNVSDELIANSGTNFVFQQATTSEIKVPTDVYLTFSAATKRIFSAGTNLTIENSTANVNFVTVNNGSVILPTNTYLEWTSTNRIRYNSTDLVLDSSGQFLVTNSTASTSSLLGAVRFEGGLSISNTTNAVSSTNGGTLTAAGGAAIAKDLYIGGNQYLTGNQFITGNLDVDGLTTLDETSINTNDGQFVVTGSNGMNVLVSNTSTIRSTVGNVVLDSDAGVVSLIGQTGILLDANAGISIDGGGASNFSTTVGTITISGIGLNLSGNTGEIDLSTTSTIDINSGIGGITLDSTDTTLGIKIGTALANVPVVIGNSVSQVIVSDNLYIGGSIEANDNTLILHTNGGDSGLLLKRDQTPNNVSSGDVIIDTPLQTSTFQAGSSTPGTLVLNASASALDDFYNGMWIQITSGPGSGQVRRIKDYNGTSKTATLYITADNTSTFFDGLNLTTAPSAGNTYSIYNRYYSSFYYSESSDEFKFTYSSLDNVSFTEPPVYAGIHIAGLIAENQALFQLGYIVDYTSATAVIVRKNGDTGNVFTVDTSAGNVIVANPDNVGSTGIIFEQYDNVNSTTVYSSVISSIIDNTAIQGQLDFNVQKDNVLSSFIRLVGTSSSTVDFTSDVDTVQFLNTTASSSSTVASVVMSGGLSISNTTNSTSSTVGGGLTVAGGVGIAQDVYIGGNLNVTGTISAGVTTPSITVSNGVNITGIVSVVENKLIANGSERILSATFRFTPTTTAILTSFEFTVPGVTTFANVYSVNVCINGYTNDADPVNLENQTGFAVTGTNRAKVKLTANGTAVHTIQIISRYTV